MQEVVKKTLNSNYAIASAIISAALIICTVIGTSTLIKIKGFGNTIRVTGAAFKPIKSNYAIWDGSISVRAASVEASYQILDADIKKTRAFLKERGFDSTTYTISPARIIRNQDREGQLVDYGLACSIHMEMSDVEKVGRISGEASELLKSGVMMESRSPRYLVTGLDTLKVEMIRAATENAQLRAEELARTTGHSVGAPRSANVGVFQIRPMHSQEVSDYGISDNSSIEKEIGLTVHIEFLID